MAAVTSLESGIDKLAKFLNARSTELVATHQKELDSAQRSLLGTYAFPSLLILRGLSDHISSQALSRSSARRI
jgi:hypothetical protein